MSTKGKFITFEGCDGCGKSTQLARLRAECARRAVPCLFTREPGGSPVAEQIRGILLDRTNAEISDECEALLYAAARVQHLKETILPALERGTLVVCDRYLDSSIAYQGAARGLGAEAVLRLNCYARLPDLTFFLDLPPAEAFRRKAGADENDRMESAGLAFHERVYRGYLAIAAAEKERVLRIDARRSPEEIHREIVAALCERGIL